MRDAFIRLRAGLLVGVSLILAAEIHMRVLPDANAFVINIFNLSDKPRTVSGQIDLRQTGLDLSRWYSMPKGCAYDRQRGTLRIWRRLKPWGCEVGCGGVTGDKWIVNHP